YSQSAQAFSKAQQKKINAGDFYRTVGWEKCTPDAASSFSAVAFYFARRIHQKLGIPVGIIQNAVGGSPTQAWISKKALANSPQLKHFVIQEEGETWLDIKKIHPFIISRAKTNMQLSLQDSVEQGRVGKECRCRSARG